MEKAKATETLKLLCSYGGKILLRHSDGKLRYVGGLTRVLAVDPSISFAELMGKLAEFCGYSVDLRCQLPNGDLETLISIKSDEDLANLVEEYDRASSSPSRPLKIRAILSAPKSLKQISPSPSMATIGSGGESSPSKSVLSFTSFTDSPPKRFVSSPQRYDSSPKRYVSPPVGFQKGSGRVCYYPCHVQRIPSDMSFLPHHHHCQHHQHVTHCNDWR